jgi:hypothetical protein
VGGLGPDDWIVVASQRDGVAIGPYAAALRRSKIRCRRRWLGRDTVVQVRYRDRDDALMMLDALGDTVRESRWGRVARRFKKACIGIGIWLGGTVGALLPLLSGWLLADPDAVVSPADLFINTGLGVLLGSLFGGLVAYTCVSRWQ